MIKTWKPCITLALFLISSIQITLHARRSDYYDDESYQGNGRSYRRERRDYPQRRYRRSDDEGRRMASGALGGAASGALFGGLIGGGRGAGIGAGIGAAVGLSAAASANAQARREDYYDDYYDYDDDYDLPNRPRARRYQSSRSSRDY